nr:hypothetical protein Iba_chr14bCG0490 [Ipomoea batatas]
MSTAVHASEFAQSYMREINKSPTEASVNDGMKHSPRREWPHNCFIDFVVKYLPLSLEVKGAQCFIVAVHFVPRKLADLGAMAGVVKQEGIPWLGSVDSHRTEPLAAAHEPTEAAAAPAPPPTSWVPAAGDASPPGTPDTGKTAPKSAPPS